MSRKGYSGRRTGNRRPYQILVIVCEGEKTERKYFTNYREQRSGLKIETPNSRVTDPVNLVNFAKRQLKGLDIDEGDQVWCVFDADHHSDQEIQNAQQIAGDDVKICLSNPSFEIWYLLHFGYFDSRISNQDLINKIKQHIPNYQKNKDYFSDILAKRTDAIKFAKRLNKKHEDEGTDLLSTNSNPSTQVFKLVEYIMETIAKNKESN